MDRLGRLPKEGDRFTDGDHKFQVEKMRGRMVEVVLIDITDTKKEQE